MNLTPKSTGTFRSYDGTKIYYEVRGEGPPVVMAYGIGCLINHWNHQISYFSRSYQTIVFDYRAHHKSDMPVSREQLNIDALAQDLRGLLDHLQIKSTSLWGHSFGAQVAVRTYDMFPDRINSLVFINGFATNPLQGMFGSDLATSFFTLVKDGYEKLPETLSFLWRVAVNNPLAIQLSALAGGFNLKLTHLKDVEIYARGIASMDLDAFLTLFENMMGYDGRAVLERIAVPALIIAGRNDSVTPQHYQEEMHQKIRGSQYLMVPYGSHCTQLDMPDLVNLKIEQFLSGLGYR
ncbi:MAG: alpha/beta fold hydrolase [Bdellovibrionales bacterium]